MPPNLTSHGNLRVHINLYLVVDTSSHASTRGVHHTEVTYWPSLISSIQSIKLHLASVLKHLYSKSRNTATVKHWKKVKCENVTEEYKLLK